MGFFKEKCIACGACRRYCKSPDECISCFSCAEVCPERARRVWGEKYTVEELLEIILADKSYYDLGGGGVTFSGGECMLYPDFLVEIMKKCQENYSFSNSISIPHLEHFVSLTEIGAPQSGQ